MVRMGQAHSRGPAQVAPASQPEERRVGRGPAGPTQRPAQSRSPCSRFHGPLATASEQGLGNASGSWEVPGARLGLGHMPAEQAGGCSPENLLLLLVLLGNQLCRFSGVPTRSGVSVLRTGFGA